MQGRCTDAYFKRLGTDAPHFTSAELAIISGPMDFVGINVYQPLWVRAEASQIGYAILANPSSYPSMLSPWLAVGDEAIYWGPRLVADIWKMRETYITENGTSSADIIVPTDTSTTPMASYFFAITYVDFATQKRMPKHSADFYRQVVVANCVG